MSLLTEINNMTNYTVALIEVFDSKKNLWHSIKDVLSFNITISRDDNRVLIYSVMPPLSTLSLKINNSKNTYRIDDESYENDYNKIGILPDESIRIFLGYKSSKIEKKYIKTSNHLIENSDNYNSSFLENEALKNVSINSNGFITFKLDENSFNKSINYIENFNDYEFIFASNIIEVSLNDDFIEMSFINSIDFDCDNFDNLYFCYRTSSSDKSIYDESFSQITKLQKSIDINKSAKSNN